MTDETSSSNAFEQDKPGTYARERAEAAIEDLRKRGGIFVDAVRATRAAMALTDPSLPGNPIIFANRSFLDLSGYSMEEVLGQQPYFMNGPDTDPEDAERFRQILTEDRDGVVETIQYAKDGRRFIATVLLSAFKDEAGKTLHHFLSWADVTRRVDAEDDAAALRKAQAALRESEVRYHNLFDSIDEGFCVVEVLFDADGKPVDYIFLETNAAFYRQTGLADAVGRRMREMAPNHEQHWFDIYGRIATTGEPQRFEQPAEALGHWYDVYAFRVGNPEQRHVAILFTDIAERKRAGDVLRESEERQGFLLKLSDALQPLAGAAEIQATTARLVGEHLGVDRAMYAEVDGEPGAETGIIRGQYVRPATGGAPSPAPFPERFTFEPFGARTMAARYRGEVLVVADVASDAAFTDAERAAWAVAGVCAAVVAPLAKGGRLVAEFGVHSATPRAWTDAEVSLVREVGERTWAAAERARAEAGLRESEEKYRSLFETIGQGYAEIELLRDNAGRAVDQLYIEFNPAFERLIGVRVSEARGRKASEVLPDLEPWWHETFDRIAKRGEPERIEHQVASLGKWYEVYAYPRGGDRLIVLYEDITQRKRADQALRESEERQAFLLALGDALRLQPSAGGKIDVAARHLGQRLGASRVLYAEFDSARGVADIFNGWLADGAEPFPAVLRLEDYEGPMMDDLRAGRTVRIDDVGPLVHQPAYADIAAIGVQALLSVPLVVSDKLVANLSVHQHEARHWTEDEVALVQEVAERLWAEVVRTRAETKLRESEERFRGFAENSADVLWILDGETRQLDYLSPAFETVWGESREAVMGDIGRWAELVHPDDREEAVGSLPRLLAGETYTATYRIVRPDGEVRWIRDTGFPIHADGITRVGGIAQDVTDLKAIEARLAAEEERLRLALRAGRLATWDWDLRSGAVTWNDEHFRMQGYAVGEVEPSYDAWAARVHPDDLESTQQALLSARDGQRDYAHEFRNLLPDGEVTWCSARGRFFYGADGTPERMIGVMEDVTRRRAAEEALRESEGRFRQFAETSTDVIWIRNAETLLYEYVSPAFETVYGGDLDELLSQNDLKRWAEFLHSEDRDRVLANLRRTKQGERVTQEFRIHREPDGEVRWIRDTDFPLLNDSGQVQRVAGIGQDITDQRRIEDALRDREERLRLIVENARDYAIFTIDENGFVTDWYDGAEAVFGWSREEIVGRDGRVLYTAEDRAAGVPEQEMRTARDEGKAPDVRWHRCKDGSAVFIEGLVTPLAQDGHVGFLKIGRDATERHRSDQALREGERHQRVLLAELQHRVRNTLAVVRSIARRTADRSEDVGDMIAHLDGRLNAFSRVQSAVTRNPAAGVDLESLIEDELLAVAAREGDHLRIEGPSIYLKPRAAESISLAIHELATNAVKYGALAIGQGQIAVKWRRVGTDGSDRLELEWEESGLDGLESPPGEGFGHEMLRRTLPYDLRAETEIEFPPHGLRFTMSMPLEDQVLADRREK